MENPEEDFEFFEEEEERGRPAPAPAPAPARVDNRPVNYRGEPRQERGRVFKEGVVVEEGRGRRRNVAKQVRQKKKDVKMNIRRRQQEQRQDMRRRRQDFQEQGMRQGVGFVNEERVGERRYIPEGRVPVRRRRANRGREEVRGLDPRRRRRQEGRGLNLMSPDEMVNRLSLIVGSVDAGNVSDDIFNEASSIIDKLYDLKAITKAQMKKLYKKYLDV